MHLLIGWPMVKRLNINRYKKLNDIAIEFDCGVNAISGTNGTCKTTLLHMISNAYKAISRKDHQFKDPEALRMINSLNAVDFQSQRNSLNGPRVSAASATRE